MAPVSTLPWDGWRHQRNGILWWMLLLLLVIPLRDSSAFHAQAEYEAVRQLFRHGYLEKSQQVAEQGYERSVASGSQIAWKYRLLEGEAMLWRGMYSGSLTILSGISIPPQDQDGIIRKLATEAVSLARLEQFGAANQKLDEARGRCLGKEFAACGEVLRAQGLFAMGRGDFDKAAVSFSQSREFSRVSRDKWLEATALLNLGTAELQKEHFDEAVDWSTAAERAATGLHAEDLAQRSLGNLGWAYFGLGDSERSLEFFLKAEKEATRLGDILFQIKWLKTAGEVYWSEKDFDRAVDSYRAALKLANPADSKEEIVDSLEDLAFISIESGKLDQAAAYINQVVPLVQAGGNRLDSLYVALAQGEIAAANRQDQQAESIFRRVQADPDSQPSMRLQAGHERARLFDLQGNVEAADRTYRAALTTFESARAELKNEDLKLSFLANASRIYDDFIHFLVKQGKTEEALAAADQSRARTLAQGLGVATNEQSFKPAALHASAIAQKADATLLFYWLGEKQSYLWAITPSKTKLLELPAQAEILPMVERYRKALLQANNGRDSFNEDGLALYRTLIAPAADLIRPNGNVVIVSDGALSLLNFETLIVPGANPHYWIEDANLVSAPSLYMLASAKASRSAGRKLLLLGDAVSPNPDYPDLPMASIEMGKIQKHFDSGEETVFARQSATSDAYLAQAPQHYSYIHFVAHGVASRTDPLDSAIILSRTTAGEDSFKLHAREIIQHPIDARLVTISACYGGGTRSYAGEGLVGLSWAFLRAGAHNVIGALWEASDASTPALMDGLYQGLEHGMTPSAALRNAKLGLLHSQGSFRQPFYWAPFQIYTGL